MSLPSSAGNYHITGIKMSEQYRYDSQLKYRPVPNSGEYWVISSTPILAH